MFSFINTGDIINTIYGKGTVNLENQEEILNAYQSSEEYSNAYYSSVSKKLQKLYIHKGFSLSELSKKCKRLGLDIDTTTISKIFNFKAVTAGKRPTSMSLVNIVTLCNVLDADINQVLSIEQRNMNVDELLHEGTSGAKDNVESFIFNPKASAFHGYLGRYYCYFHSTISGEDSIIHATLDLSHNLATDQCDAEFRIDTLCEQESTIDWSDDNNKKIYTGRMVISIQQSSCYCILTNPRIGEVCMFTFHHRFFNSQDMQCRLAATVTVSAGDNRRPTMHRLLLCRRELSEKELQDIRPQLRMNSSKIIVSQQAVDKLIENQLLSPETIEALHTIGATGYYKFHESLIKDLSISPVEKRRDICALRGSSEVREYAKVGKDADTLVHQMLFK